jgi:hypothetical protein
VEKWHDATRIRIVGARAFDDNHGMEKTSFVLECRHCANRAPMEVIVEKSFVEEHEEGGFDWEACFIYQILRCYSCSEVTVYQIAIHTGIDPEYADRSHDKMLYPSGPESLLGLPAGVQKAWDASMRVRKIDPNAFAVLLGRVLDAICADQHAVGDSLYMRIEHLAESGRLPERLKAVAHGLRGLRNFGADGDLGQLEAKDVPLLESLCQALLMFLYTVPALAKDAQERLDRSNTRS